MRLLFFLFFPIFLFGELSVDEKIGQLFIIPLCSKDEAILQETEALLEKIPCGGVLLKAGTCEQHAHALNRLQKKIPLICCLDAEWGIGMRVEDGISFPRALTLGAIADDALLYDLGVEIGRQCREIGGHINFAPVADINSNSLNPIIHKRSFGDDRVRVARNVLQISKGMASQSIFPCAKHFPGHGDASVDSHRDLPFVAAAIGELKERELFPFQLYIDAGLPAIMMGHLLIEGIDPDTVSTLSKKCVTDLLKGEMGFEGLVITDALNMKALSRYYTPEEIALRAFKAGNDMLLYGSHLYDDVMDILHDYVPRGFAAIKEAVQRGEISIEELDKRVEKILRAKKKLEVGEDVSPRKEVLHSDAAYALKKRLYQKAVTLVGDMPPISSKVGYFCNTKQDYLRPFLEKSGFTLVDPEDAAMVLVAIGDVPRPNYRFESEFLKWIEVLKREKEVLFVLFDTPYTLLFNPEITPCLAAYENVPDASEAAVNILVGKEKAEGILPISSSH